MRSYVQGQTGSEGVWRSHLLSPEPPLGLVCNLTWLSRPPPQPAGTEGPPATLCTHRDLHWNGADHLLEMLLSPFAIETAKLQA